MLGEPVDLVLAEGTFRAFGSACRVVSDLGHESVRSSVHRLEDLEQRWSRFVGHSEVSRLNDRAGEWVECSEATVDLIDRAVAASLRSKGVFNPLVLGALTDLGYDRAHWMLAPADGEPSPGPEVELLSPFAIEIDSGWIRLPRGAAFDPGGIGKGLAADLVVDDLLGAGATWAYVSLGGDVRFGGDALACAGTPVALEHPLDPGTTWRVTSIRRGGVASSSTCRRRWSHGGRTHHHLLDRRGRSTTGPRIAATVHAESAWWADVVAKCLVIEPDSILPEFDPSTVRALIFDESGAVESIGWDDADLSLAVEVG